HAPPLLSRSSRPRVAPLATLSLHDALPISKRAARAVLRGLFLRWRVLSDPWPADCGRPDVSVGRGHRNDEPLRALERKGGAAASGPHGGEKRRWKLGIPRVASRGGVASARATTPLSGAASSGAPLCDQLTYGGDQFDWDLHRGMSGLHRRLHLRRRLPHLTALRSASKRGALSSRPNQRDTLVASLLPPTASHR